jgi:hypothetical protein
MKKIKSILAISSLGVLSIGTAAAIVGCNKTSNTDVELVSLAANGTPGIETTTKLTLTTNINIKNLKKDDITITDTNTSTKLTVGTIKLISDTTYDINITGT